MFKNTSVTVKMDSLSMIRSCELRLFVLLFLIPLPGCKKGPVVNKGPEGVYNLMSVAKAYTATALHVRPPKSLDDMMPALKNIGDPERLLRSSRDGKPYVFVWEVDVRQPMSRGNTVTRAAPVIAYEQLGKDGKRQAVNTALQINEYSEDEFARLRLPVPGNPPE